MFNVRFEDISVASLKATDILCAMSLDLSKSGSDWRKVLIVISGSETNHQTSEGRRHLPGGDRQGDENHWCSEPYNLQPAKTELRWGRSTKNETVQLSTAQIGTKGEADQFLLYTTQKRPANGFHKHEDRLKKAESS